MSSLRSSTPTSPVRSTTSTTRTLSSSTQRPTSSSTSRLSFPTISTRGSSTIVPTSNPGPTNLLPTLPSSLSTFTSSFSSTTTTTTSTISSIPQPTNQPENTGLSGGAKAGIGIGAAIGVGILVALAYFLGARRWKKKKNSSMLPTQAYNGFPPPHGPNHPIDTKQQILLNSPSPSTVYAHKSPNTNTAYPNSPNSTIAYPNSPNSVSTYPNSPNSNVAYTNTPNQNIPYNNNTAYLNTNTAYTSPVYSLAPPTPGVSELPVPIANPPDNKPAAAQHGFAQAAELSADQSPRSSRQAEGLQPLYGNNEGPTIKGAQSSHGYVPAVQNPQQAGHYSWNNDLPEWKPK
ncbi:hypothetical protein B0J11DRAFT_575305 [Dendryphion nanum]|uniref:Uncharacterized protein n=1 Tax=Dendryphion nanum TaxID=256645 RepID=A0A9P9EKM0_9PLEO|nr:hypothetical protein B0J11DRAFT_575305 [Dendryphion nanum]